MKIKIRFLVFLLLFSIMLFPAAAASAEEASVLTCHFPDVGQGLAVLLECDGHFALYDGGGPESSQFVVSYLKDAGVEQLDLVIASHYDLDHVSGLVGVLHVFPTLEVWGPDYVINTNIYDSLMREADELGYSFFHPAQNETRSLGSAELKVLSDGLYHEKENDRSIVLQASLNDSSLLLTGDLTWDGEHELIDQGIDLRSDILVLGHHGSSSSTSWSFLAAVSPSSVVVSCGKDNDFGHPSSRTMERVQDFGSALFRTDLQGTVTASFLPDGKIVWNTAQCDDYSGRNWDPEASAAGKETRSEEPSADITYILNGSSFRFHRPDCEMAAQISAKNRVEFTGTRDEAIALGYDPCGVCRP